MPPQPGDRLVFLTGPKNGQVIKVDDLPVGGPQVQAYPMSPEGTVRTGSRLNLVILARFDPAGFDDETRARSAEGVVAYGAPARIKTARSTCGRRTATHSSVPATAPSSIPGTAPRCSSDRRPGHCRSA